MKKKQYILIITSILISIAVKAQENIQFNQYIFNGLYINPAYAGYRQDLYINSFYRSQWTGITGAPQTVALTADGALNDSKVGLGLVIQGDKFGAQSYLAAYGNYAYHLQLNDAGNSMLTFGIGFGFIQSGINGSELSAVQANDTFIPTGNLSIILPDARAGILFSTEQFFAGVSVDNMLAKYIHTSSVNALLVPVPQPNEYLNMGLSLFIKDDVKFRPSILFRDSRNNPTSMDINALFLLGEKVCLGATYRTDISIYNKPGLTTGIQKSRSMVALVEFKVSQALKLGYAFDYSLNQIATYGNGSHELSLSFNLNRSRSGNPVSSPEF